MKAPGTRGITANFESAFGRIKYLAGGADLQPMSPYRLTGGPAGCLSSQTFASPYARRNPVRLHRGQRLLWDFRQHYHFQRRERRPPATSPYRDAGRLVLLWTTRPQTNAFERPTGFLTFRTGRIRSPSKRCVLPQRTGGPVGRTRTGTNRCCFRIPDFFALLGIQPVCRSFTNREAERGETLVVMSYGIWQRRFGGSPKVLGSGLHIEGRQATVVGVMPAGFRLLTQTTQLWMPHTSASFFDSIRTARDSKFGWDVLAKLRPGVRLEQAQTEMNGVAARLAAAWPETNQGPGVRVVSLLDQVTSQVRLALKLLLAAVISYS